ncbi:DUF6624 domain-containing protein [Pedobacter sp. SYP-B3415]|uniref:DUF6624 domain-containing protein n=1 Tax=Pedobacter sp. SYP-B3415 TaxID=2496641 RepID=UPI00101C2AA3|nr:DUF6624 domain-containing protein [Pedobacter sp. SYP-B3415]
MKYTLLIPAFLFCIAAKAQVSSFNIDSTKFNQPLKASLDSIFLADQAPRLRYMEARQKKESQTHIDSLRTIMVQEDKRNLAKCLAILEKHGWQGPQKVGMIGSQALFLVIQHADLETQKKYLPMIREAENKGEILSSNLAILEDRINVREGKQQLFGSQAFTDKQSGKLYFYPIANIDQLEKNRKRMGLLPMPDYARQLNIDWDPEVYKKMLPEIEQIVARQKI